MQYVQNVLNAGRVSEFHYDRVSTKYDVKMDTIIRYWDTYARISSVATEAVPLVSDITGFMYYRFLGYEDLDGTVGSGSVCLSTFISSQLSILLNGMRRRFRERFTINEKDVFTNVHFKNCVIELMDEYGENRNYSGANPIWFMDEVRLLNALGFDTKALRDRALIRVMTRSGSRMGSISQVRFHRDVLRGVREEGRLAFIQISIPAIKAHNGRRFLCEITSEDAEAYFELDTWLLRREVILKESPFLFCTTVGDQLTTETVSKMLSTLSRAAGYGDNFFSSHSGRHGFCCRRLALEYSKGNSASDAHDGLAGTGHWKYNSDSIKRYCETKVKKYFSDPQNSKTWDEFKVLSPIDLHGLSHLGDIRIRGNSWFMHDEETLRVVGQYILCKEFRAGMQQGHMRANIGERLMSFDPDFNAFVVQRNGGCSKTAVSLLFEWDLIRQGFKFSEIPDEMQDILASVLQNSVQSRDKVTSALQPLLNARHLRIHKVNTMAEAYKLRTRLLKRTRDRQTNLVQVRTCNNAEFLVTCPAREENTHEARNLPRLPLPLPDVVLEEDDEDVLPTGEPMQVHSDPSGAMSLVPVSLPVEDPIWVGSDSEELIVLSPLWVGSDNEDPDVRIASPISRQASRVLQTPSTVASISEVRKKKRKD